MGHMPPCISRSFHHGLYLVRSVFVYTDCDKRRQTSRPVVGAEIKTLCYLAAYISNCTGVLGYINCLRIDAVLEIPYNLMGWLHRDISVSRNIDSFLRQDFLYSALSFQ